jgi:hypothetical protein
VHELVQRLERAGGQVRPVRRHVRPQLGPKEVSALTRHDFVRILNAASATGLARSTVADVGAVCRSIVTFAIEQRLLVDNPMLGVHFRVTSDVAGEDALAVSPDEIPTVEDVLRLSRLAGALVARRGDDAAGVLGR